MNIKLQQELEDAYFELWAAVENGIDTDTFFKLREKYRDIRNKLEANNPNH